MGALRRTWVAARAEGSGHGGVVLTLAAALALLGLFVQLTGGARRVVEGWGQAARLRCELDGALPAADQEISRLRLAALPGVGGAELVTAEAALARFRARGPQARALVEGIDAQLLPASVELSVEGGAVGWREGERIALLAAAVPGVAQVAGGLADFTRLGQLARLAHLGALALGAAALAFVAAIVANTIRLALARQADEVAVMRLVGATWGFIAAPYLLLAAAWGVAAGLAASAALAAADALLAGQLGAGPGLAGGAGWRLFAPQVAGCLLLVGTTVSLLAALWVLWRGREAAAR